MSGGELHGYLLVHFVEDAHSHTEKIYFSLSEGDDPLRWRRLNGGEAVLEWTGGTGGVRDPHIVRGPDGFHVVATDLRVWRPEGADWWEFSHRGSRDLVVWDSPDLLTWSPPRAVTVAPVDAGMAWAPESVYDPISGDYLVHWASSLSGTDDPERSGEGPSRILVSRTRDFRTFTEPTTYLERPGGVIDLTVLVTTDGVHRFAKQDDDAPDSWHVFHQKGARFDDPQFRTLARHIGQEIAPRVEAPLVFKANDAARWYLWVDQYAHQPQGYQALTTTDLDSGSWTRVPPEDFHLPPNTKHGAVLPLLRREHEALDARW
ncbi:glycoside hydrolase family 43 protein [Cellulomonas soli]|uniref:glycoside hydrolase family 43 protein n=1 Tax=Cellulomonas soli TaxID=931535 RepID=UPI003F845969